MRLELLLAVLAVGLGLLSWKLLQPPQPVTSWEGSRLGFEVALSRGNVTDYPHICQLDAGWFHDVTFRASYSAPCGMEYVQTIEIPQGAMPNTNALRAAVQAHTGSLWLIGNEPDCVYQDNVLPADYARVYHDLYYFIKGIDPTAQVALGGIVQPTPLRLQYLDLILAEYQSFYSETIAVDVWNIHNMILNEVRNDWGADIPPGLTDTVGVRRDIQDNDSFALFKEQVLAFRNWMKVRGYQDRPLIITEFGVLMPEELGFPVSRVSSFMLATFNYLSTAADPALGYPGDCYRLVQRWAWYVLNDDTFEWSTNFRGNLIAPDTGELTTLGTFYASYVPPAFTDVIAAAFSITPDPVPAWEPVRLTLAFTVEAQGEGGTLQDVLVRFYDGYPAPGGSNQIGLDRVIPTLPAPCSRGRASVSLEWVNPPQGQHTIYARVDPEHDLSEADMGNNTLSRAIFVPTRQLYFPLAVKNSG